MSNDKMPNENDLDVFFEAARASAPNPDDELIARILEDAEAVQPAAPIFKPQRSKRQGWLAALGGWPALAGLATATVAGVSIGMADPIGVGDIAFAGFGDGYDFSSVGAGFELGLDDG